VRRRFRIPRVAAGVAFIAGLAAVASVALVVYVADHAGTRPAAALPTAAMIPTTATWSVASEFDSVLNSATGGQFNAVTCVSSTECWAVRGGIIERYSGTSWSAAAAPEIADSTLFGIGCAGAYDCWAVGSVDNGPMLFSSPGTPLIEHYTGGAWVEVTAPNSLGVLNAVTCSSADDCWAVGGPSLTAPNAELDPPLIDHYSGGTWMSESAPGAGTLDGIACPVPGNCWAVGAVGWGSTGSPLIAHYSSGVWTTVASSNLLAGVGGLLSVACVTKSDCWAVGGVGLAGQIAHDTNGAWSAQPASVPLSSIACLSSGVCWAVGSDAGGAISNLIGGAPTPSPSISLIEYYNGATWMPVTTPPAGSPASVACVAADECWAVGGSSSTALIETTVTPSGAG
jgi:hypothetical protein